MPKLSLEKKGKIEDLRKKGYSYRSIAERAKVSSETAYKYGKGIKMKEDKRYDRGGSVKEAVKKESRNLIGIKQIKPSHREKFDQLISEQFDNAVKGLAQFLGLGSSRFVGLFGFGRSLANIAIDAERSETYTVLPLLKNVFFGEQKLPALPLRRKFFIRRISEGLIVQHWEKIEKMLKSGKT